MQSTQSEKLHQEAANTVPCKYCREEIPQGALICKTCGEPLDQWHRAMRFMTTVLTSVVAIGSLFVAYLQHEDAKQANIEAAQAKTNESAEHNASEDAIRQLSRLYYGARTNAYQRGETPGQKSREQMLLSPEFRSVQNLSGLQSRLATNPANIELRKEILMRQFVAPNGSP